MLRTRSINLYTTERQLVYADLGTDMPSFYLVYVVCLVALALVSQAQHELHSGGLDLSQYHISHLQSQMQPTSDTFDGVKVERIISILQSNLQFFSLSLISASG